MLNKVVFRVAAFLVHLLLNFIFVSYLLSFDWTGSWWRFFLFILILLVLFILFVKHLVTFITFLKTNA